MLVMLFSRSGYSSNETWAQMTRRCPDAGKPPAGQDVFLATNPLYKTIPDFCQIVFAETSGSTAHKA
jgi:hypothetical protein